MSGDGPRRVMVIGCGGSGKSTLSRALAERTGLPLVHLDARYWSSGWVPTPAAEWHDRVVDLAAEPRWILDGNYGGTLDLRLARADTVVFLDVPGWRCLGRVVARRLRHRGRSRPSMAPGCPDRVTLQFVWWILTYRRRRRPGILARLAALGPRATAHVLTTPGDVRRFLQRFETGGSTRGEGHD